MVASYAVLSPAGVRHAVTFRCLGQAVAEVDYRGDASTVVSLPSLVPVYRIVFDRAAWGLPASTVRA